jgi:hypothetical protein
MTSIEAKYNQLLDENAALQRIIASLKASLVEARRLVAQTELEERIQDLPPEARERLRKAFPGSDLAGSKQAINIERRNLSKKDARVERILGQ